ncbi:MAG: transposase [Deltaproteobacteria bacterium]|nr:transposase [Deltaproteobacteria bacterium]
MEFLSGPFKIRDILLHNDNWFIFYIQYSYLLRPAITENVIKVLSCKTPLLGFHLYTCPCCDSTKKIPHSCTSCGKIATDKWITHALKTMPNVSYQHITFTMPNEYWPLFRVNRYLLGELPAIAAGTVIKICKKGKKRKHYLPGIFLAIHTAGRDVEKFNYHIHLSTTVGGFSIENKNKFINGSTIDHKIIKSMWRYQITTLLRNHFKNGKLYPYPAVKNYFINLTTFNKWLDSHYQKSWNVFLQKPKKDPKQTVNYLGKYLKRPPLAETKILSYDGESVTFTFVDHYTDSKQTKTIEVFDFIKALICHIPDKYFRMVRYYCFFANRVRTKYLKLLNPNFKPGPAKHISYAQQFYNSFGKNPLECVCGHVLLLRSVLFAKPMIDLLQKHNLKASRLTAT